MVSIENVPLKPTDEPTPPESRVVGAWHAWLDTLATNAEAALAAALAYKQLEGAARDSWLSALEQDSERLSVPKVAVFAPLLAVEIDPERRERIANAIGGEPAIEPGKEKARALVGFDRHGLRVAVIVAPLYLDFVQVLACGYQPQVGFEWVRHEPILRVECAPTQGQLLEGAKLDDSPLKVVIDELAHAVVAQRRANQPLPEALSFFAYLFEARDVQTWPAVTPY